MNTKAIIIIVVFAVIFGFLFWKRQDIINAIIPPSAPTDNGNKDDKKNLNPKKDDSFPLAQGSRGERVKKLQQIVNKKTGAGLAEDGIYGPKTSEAFSRVGLPTMILEDIYNNFVKKYEN
jgi:hypothetical protein